MVLKWVKYPHRPVESKLKKIQQVQQSLLNPSVKLDTGCSGKNVLFFHYPHCTLSLASILLQEIFKALSQKISFSRPNASVHCTLYSHSYWLANFFTTPCLRGRGGKTNENSCKNIQSFLNTL